MKTFEHGDFLKLYSPGSRWTFTDEMYNEVMHNVPGGWGKSKNGNKSWIEIEEYAMGGLPCATYSRPRRAHSSHCYSSSTGLVLHRDTCQGILLPFRWKSSPGWRSYSICLDKLKHLFTVQIDQSASSKAAWALRQRRRRERLERLEMLEASTAEALPPITATTPMRAPITIISHN